MKLFKNFKNVFSSLYWYRWRKNSKVSDLKDLLSNSWDMVDSVFDLLIAKTEQVMTYIRNNGHEVRRYIDSTEIISDANKLDKFYIADRILYEDAKESKNNIVQIPYKTVDDDNSLSKKGTYYFEAELNEDDTMSYRLVYGIAIKIKPTRKIPKDLRYYYVSEGSDIKNAKLVKNIQYYYSYNVCGYFDGASNFAMAEKRARESYNVSDLVDRIILSKSSFNVKPEDLKKLSESLLHNVRGALYTYHEMWQFRKMLLECKKYNYDWPDDYWETYEKIKDDDNAVDALNKTYEAKRKGVMIRTFEFFIDHYRNWWD